MDGLPKSGLLTGLPDDWIDCHQAFQQCWKALGWTDQAKITLAAAAFQRAFFSGDLPVSAFDGKAFKRLPKAAFVNLAEIERSLIGARVRLDSPDIAFELDPLWPDEWQAWSNKIWAIPSADFESWLASGALSDVAGLPIETPLADDEVIERLHYREPSKGKYIPLTEAYSWIAFRIALDANRLEEALRWGCFANGDLQQAQAQIANAVEQLLDAGADGQIQFIGRLADNHKDKTAPTGVIEPLNLYDYRSFTFGFDELRHGRGPLWTFESASCSSIKPSLKRDLLADVKVSRDDLLRLFPAKAISASAAFMPTPATLPDLGPMIPLEEAVNWLAYGRPNYSIQIWTDGKDDWQNATPEGTPISPDQGKEIMAAYGQANSTIHNALRLGDLTAIVAPGNGPPLKIPALYWNPINPEAVHSVYEGMTPDDRGAGCPVLLVKQAFDEWRAKASTGTTLDHGAIIKKTRRKPGRPPDSDWPNAIAKVTQDCRSAGYKRPLKRGGKAAIITMLLNFMADKDKHFSEDIASKHAEDVIDALPDN